MRPRTGTLPVPRHDRGDRDRVHQVPALRFVAACSLWKDVLMSEDLKDRLGAIEHALTYRHCDDCGGVRPSDKAEDCPDCIAKYGPVLVKASCDHWPILVTLQSGEFFVAMECKLYGEWVVFTGSREDAGGVGIRVPANSYIYNSLEGRGLAVPVSNIAWVVDTDS